MTPMMLPSPESYKQITEAYRRMAHEANYRPAAPSDGCGNITVPAEDLDLQRESDKYAKDWWADEDDHSFFIGCCSFKSREATIFAVEAARLMCSGDVGHARQLLKMAVSSLKGKN